MKYHQQVAAICAMQNRASMKENKKITRKSNKQKYVKVHCLQMNAASFRSLTLRPSLLLE